MSRATFLRTQPETSALLERLMAAQNASGDGAAAATVSDDYEVFDMRVYESVGKDTMANMGAHLFGQVGEIHSYFFCLSVVSGGA